MSTDYSKMTPEQLLAQRTEIDAEISRRGTSGPGKKGSKEKKEKKPKRKSNGTAWADFGKKVIQEHTAEYEAFKADPANPKQGVMPLFVSRYRSQHEAEWTTFQAAWNESHPKAEKPSKACEIVSSAENSDAEAAPEPVTAASQPEAPSAEKKRRGPKKLSEMTAEERSAHDAKVAERKTKKATTEASKVASAVAEAPVSLPPPPPTQVTVAEPQAETESTGEVELRKFQLDGHTYIRPWSGDDWASTDLWYTDSAGAKANYFGELMDDGSVNTDAEEPEFN